MFEGLVIEDGEGRLEYSPPTFHCAHGLAMKLLATDAEGMRPCDVHLPYDHFVIEPPRVPNMRYAFFGVLNGAAYAARYPQSAKRLETLGFPRDSIEICDLDFGCYTYLRPDERLRDQAMSAEQLTFAQFVLNFCLFLETMPSSVRHKHQDTIDRLAKGPLAKRNTTKERLARLRAEKVFDVGTEITVDPRIEEGLFRNGPGWKLCYRTLVRGHWRNQAHGEGRTQRKLRWIEPHVRGSEGPVMTHRYKVDE